MVTVVRRRSARTLSSALALAASLALTASAAGTHGPDVVRFFATDSPLNIPIPNNAEIDPRSDAYVMKMVQVAEQGGGLAIAVKRWTTPVYFAKASTHRRAVKLTAPWAPRRYLLNVPIPPGARPDPADDGHMAIVDLANRCEYDLYEAARLADGSWTAKWANRIELDGDGIFDHGLSARGSGFALLAGLIRPVELKARVIPHALVFSYPYTRAGGPVAPATESDGDSSLPQALPQGARVQLDPSFDVTALPQPWQRTLARTLQSYGMFLADDGANTIGLFAANPQAWRANPYPWGDVPYAYLPGELVRHLRVLKLSRQTDRRTQVVPSRCATFR
jgi:hypothetical protein